MADVKISALPAATAAGDTDLLPVVQGGATKRATVAQVRAGLATTTALTTGLAGKSGTGHTHASGDVSGLGTAATRNVGTAAGTVAAGDDSRLSDARTPTTHAASHAAGGADEMTPAAIGAATAVHGHDASEITSGTIDLARLPAAAVERMVTVADDAARMALTTGDVQEGDVVQVGGGGPMYRVVDDTQLSVEAGYRAFTAGFAASVPWSGVADKPASYPPSAHGHTIADVSGLQSTLDAIGGTQVFYARESRVAGTDGGTFTSGAWRTRALTDAPTNTISGASLAANQITLPAGTYDVVGSAPAHGCDRHKTKLHGISGTAGTLLVGTSENTAGVDGVVTRSVIRGRITIAAMTVCELQHICLTTKATNGFGLASSMSEPEIYTEIMIRRVA